MKESKEAAAIMNFVNLMIGALDSGFVDKNNPTLSQIYQVARHHIKDTYDVDTPNIIEAHGIEIAKDCGLSNDLYGETK